ncbi:LacI family DNA-binding transcriptional regulator [Gorillibacterium massiliense]|uniref:LacI family DNA-binding transcriptional regulator n=1 Tax=Gorillibacterium massiliense TaxID=1280390 RepID=UPI0004AE3C71|nr:LacI family DNA-binding transcriptional regulator [Gorillibacterium massiliense]
MKDKVTIQQIADLAGVSKFAVSRALAGKPGVSNTTREMIIKTAGQLGYFKKAPAAQTQTMIHPIDPLPGEVAGAIVVLFPNIRYQNKDSMYWGPVFDGVSTRLNQRKMDIITLTEPSSDRVFSLLNPEAIQGMITLGSVSTQILLDIKQLGIPVVMVDHLDPAFQADTVFTDNITSMRELTLKLISKGYRKYQFVGNIHDAYSFYERWLGFWTTLSDYDIPLTQNLALLSPEMDNDNIEAVISKQIETMEVPEVFVCVNDTTAMFVMNTLKAKGIEVPGHVVVTGFDNTHPNLPILATVDINEELLGMRAVDQLLWRIVNRNTNFEKTLIQANVIIRDLSAAVREPSVT